MKESEGMDIGNTWEAANPTEKPVLGSILESEALHWTFWVDGIY